jgi:hypothetical protein
MTDGAGNGAIVGAGADIGTRLSLISTTPPRFLLLLERRYAKDFKKPAAISLEFHHSCYRGLTTAAFMVQLARKWMVATGTNPSIIAQKPNDDTIRKSCTPSRTFACV